MPFTGGEASVAGGEGVAGSVGGSFVAVAGDPSCAGGVDCVGEVCVAGGFAAGVVPCEGDVGLLGDVCAAALGCAAGTGLREGTFAGEVVGEGVRAGIVGCIVTLFMFARFGRLNVEFLMSSSSVKSITGLTSYKGIKKII
jgi:hypothetical protein